MGYDVSGILATRRETAAESLQDMVFGFLEEDEMLPESYGSDESREMEIILDDDEEEKKNEEDLEEDKKFWQNQHQLLQDTLYRTTSLETKIRTATKEAIKEIQSSETVCPCGRPMATDCRSCLMKKVSGRLRNAGLNSAICKSKWRSSPDIPSGEHTFLDVIEISGSKKREVRVIVELNFQAEFEMARASEEYNRLVQRLPEIFVGKVERLQNVIKIICAAAKKCMKEKKMHMGPWRKQKYVQAKWLGRCERITATTTTTASSDFLSLGHSKRLPKPKASMLTVDLLEMVPHHLRRPAVVVV